MRVSLFQTLADQPGDGVTHARCGSAALAQLWRAVQNLATRVGDGLVLCSLSLSASDDTGLLQRIAAAGRLHLFSDPLAVAPALPGAIPVALPADSPARHEQFFCILSPRLPVIVCARERPASDEHSPAARYDLAWSLDPAVICQFCDGVKRDWIDCPPDLAAAVQAARESLLTASIDPGLMAALLQSLLDAIGQLHHSAAQDVAEHRRFEAALRESEERYRLLVELSPDMICVTDGAQLIYINDAGAALLGATSPSDLIGAPLLQHVAPEHHSLVEDGVQVVRSEHQPSGLQEMEFVRLDGQRVDVEVVAIPFTYRGQPAIQAVVRDITARKRAEEGRRAIERKLLEAQKLESLGVLAGGIAHDFNNLLAIILGNASLALLEAAPHSSVRTSLEQVERAARRAADLTQQMLAYSGNSRFAVRQLDLNALIAEVNPLVQRSLPTSIMLSYQLTSRPLPVEADAMQLRQMMMSLFANAVEAIGDQPGTITVVSQLQHADQAFLAGTHLAQELPEGEYAAIAIRDSGCGMDEATVARAFEPFFSTKFTGRGLGLAAVLGIVRGHGGAIKVESAPGQGTVFTLLFPINRVAPIEAAGVPADQGRAPAELLASGQTILVVDDEEGVRAVVSASLERAGFLVLRAADGVEGVELFRSNADTISCVVLDLMMPRMNGDQALREILQIRPEARVILMSGYGAEEVTTRVVGLLPAELIQKPFSLTELRSKVWQVLGEG